MRMTIFRQHHCFLFCNQPCTHLAQVEAAVLGRRCLPCLHGVGVKHIQPQGLGTGRSRRLKQLRHWDRSQLATPILDLQLLLRKQLGVVMQDLCTASMERAAIAVSVATRRLNLLRCGRSDIHKQCVEADAEIAFREDQRVSGVHLFKDLHA